MTLFSCLLLKWSILFVNSCQIITPTCFNLHFNTLIGRKELGKSERIKKMGMPHLMTEKTITSLEPKLFEEVGGGRPLQLCRWTYFAKFKSKRIIAEKRPKFNKTSSFLFFFFSLPIIVISDRHSYHFN